MQVCIRCNPISELLVDDEGKLYCRYHGAQYILEERPDPEPEVEPVEEQPQ